jgi:hypothetical protein
LLIKPILTGVPVAFLPGRYLARPAEVVAALAVPPAVDVPAELGVLELLLLHAAAAVSVVAVRRISAAGRSARLAWLPCFVAIMSYLTGRGGRPGRSRWVVRSAK